MKLAILTLISSLILFVSCKSQTLGLYIGEIDSQIKHLSNSTIKLKDDNQFELTYSITSLESKIPSTRISEIQGKFKKESNHLILFPVLKKTNWLSYGENPDTLNLNPNGARKSALVVVDTSYGEIQIIQEPEPIKFNITQKQNSLYIWNDENCFIKYKDTEASNDLKNYCAEFKGSISQDNNNSISIKKKLYYGKDSKESFSLLPKESIIEFKNNIVSIIDFPANPAGMLRYSLGTYKLRNENLNEIQVKIVKSISFSMNIGQLVWYTKDCLTNFNLQITENGGLIRSNDTKSSKEIEYRKPNSKKEMHYVEKTANKLPISYDWVSKLKYFEDTNKLKKCKGIMTSNNKYDRISAAFLAETTTYYN